MDRLNKLSSYFNEKERKRLDALTRANRCGLPEMTVDEIRLSCLENDGYDTPELNEKLYLHFRGFKKIENLDKYTGCKAIWLDSNGFEKIENLECMTELRCLYLSKNLINTITGLDTLHNLTMLDLSDNKLTFISNLSNLPNLQTVNFSRNSLASADAISHLIECEKIQNIDVTNNLLPADESVMEVISKIPALTAVSISGNEVAKLPSFRKRMITMGKKLGYLDRPIEPQERVSAEAFVSGGIEAETAARDAWRESQRQKRLDEMANFRSWQAAQQQANREANAKAKAEGRSAISKITEEERKQREEDAKRAGDEERRALQELGIGKIANRYWQLEGQGNVKGDILDEATAQLLAEEDARKEAENEPRVVELRDDDDKSSPTKAEPVVDLNDIDTIETDTPPPPSSTETIMPPMPPSATEIKEVENVTVVEEVENVTVVEEVENVTLVEEVENAKEERERQQRVADSWAIYKQQQANEKNRQNNQTKVSNSNEQVVASSNTKVSTWDKALIPNALSESNKADPVLFWTEEMDLGLSKAVKSSNNNYDDIAIKMKAAADGGDLGVFGKENSCYITADSCMKRWKELDANVWSEIDPQSTIDAVHKICIDPSVIGTGHGSQPTYSQLASLSIQSKYLNVPVAFPSTSDFEHDDDDEDDDNIQIVESKHKSRSNIDIDE